MMTDAELEVIEMPLLHNPAVPPNTTTATATATGTTTTTPAQTKSTICVEVDGDGCGDGCGGDGVADAQQVLTPMLEQKDESVDDDEATCGFWIFKGVYFDRLAKHKWYTLLYGLAGCYQSATLAYYNGTITSMEKEFGISTRNSGIISIGNNISQTIVVTFLSYYVDRGHRPRWIAFGLLAIVAFCLLSATPHFLFANARNAPLPIELTQRFNADDGDVAEMTYNTMATTNVAGELERMQLHRLLCKVNQSYVDGSNGFVNGIGGGGGGGGGVAHDGDDVADVQSPAAQCGGSMTEANLMPQAILFVAQFISGIGIALYYTLGIAYMDDNTSKTQTPTHLSTSFFLNMLGPSLGYALVSFCMRFSSFTFPSIGGGGGGGDRTQSHWIGAWWLGWLPLAIVGMLFSILFSMFPRQLPATRRTIEPSTGAVASDAVAANANANVNANAIVASSTSTATSTSTSLTVTVAATTTTTSQHSNANDRASYADLLQTLKRLCTNKILMTNNISSVFYFFGYTPYWVYTPKYLEIQFRQTASSSSMATGSVAFIFTAAGILLSGIVLTKWRPSARYMAAWNVLVGLLSVVGIVAYAYIACTANESAIRTTLHYTHTERQSSTTSSRAQLMSLVNGINANAAAIAIANTCNANCYCDAGVGVGQRMPYEPVCGADGNTYTTPCHAGCTAQHINANGEQTFYDCACIRGNGNGNGIGNVVDVGSNNINNNNNNNNNGNDDNQQRSIATRSSYYVQGKAQESNAHTSTATTTTTTTTMTATITSTQRDTDSNINPTATMSPSVGGNSVAGTGGINGSVDGGGIGGHGGVGVSLGHATPGACSVNCMTQFYVYLTVMCVMKFLGAAGRTSNLIIALRCVSERDKTVALGFGMMLISVFTFMPSPIFFGWLYDRYCLLWGVGGVGVASAAGCTRNVAGNCWLYDVAALRLALNWTAAAFVSIGTLFDCAVWYYSKDLQVFD